MRLRPPSPPGELDETTCLILAHWLPDHYVKNMASSANRKYKTYRLILHCFNQSRAEPRLQITCTQNLCAMWTCVLEMCKRTDRRTDNRHTLIAILRPRTGGGVIMDLWPLSEMNELTK